MIPNAPRIVIVAKMKKITVSVVEATSISGIPLLEQDLGLIGPFVTFDTTREEFDSLVDLIFQLASHFTAL